MKRTKFVAFLVALTLMLTLSACASPSQSGTSAVVSESANTLSPATQPIGQIYLYGEQHGVKKILDKELELWYGYYHTNQMRHLFVEYGYYTAELLNLWMQAENDAILEDIYKDWEGTASYNLDVTDFLKQIKIQCPETIFHGTDVGHQYDTTGERFLEILRNNYQENSEQYIRTQEVMEQGMYYYEHEDDIYRENKMVENFMNAFDQLNGENVMGIYGSAHTGLEAMDYTQSVACMANQLKEHYGPSVHSEDLSGLAKDIEPQKVETLVVDGKEYQASYFGEEDLTGFKDYAYRAFWRLDNAYDAFANQPKSGDNLPCDNYPMLIEGNQIFVIDYGKTDGSVTRGYYIFNGQMWEGRPTTEEILIG